MGTERCLLSTLLARDRGIRQPAGPMRDRIVLFAAIFAASPLAGADSLPVPAPPPPAFLPAPPGAPELRYDLRIDLPIMAAGAAAWIGSELAKKSLAPASCRWCETAGDGSNSLNGFDSSIRNALRLSNPAAADTASSALAYGVAPLFGLGFGALAAWHDGRPRNIGADFLVIAEATIAAGDITQAVKFASGRERPFVHALSPANKALTSAPADNNLSFISGHTSFAFSLAVASGTVASMRHYRLAPLIWATGLAAAATVGYLRIAADRHYATDVIAGAAVGSAVGFAIPYFFHRPLPEIKGVKYSIGAMPSGAGVSLSGTF